MKKLFSIILIALSGAAFGQNVETMPMLVDGRVWNYLDVVNIPSSHPYYNGAYDELRYYSACVCGERELEGKTYKLIRKHYEGTPDTDDSCYLMYEEAGRVSAAYYRYVDGNGNEEFYPVGEYEADETGMAPLLDFSLGVDAKAGEYSVLAIDNICQNGVERRRQSIGVHTGSGDRVLDYWIEGIGSITRRYMTLEEVPVNLFHETHEGLLLSVYDKSEGEPVVLFRNEEYYDGVTLQLGKQPLSTLLTDPQKQSVRHLTFTGTPLSEDYAAIRSLLEYVTDLNLRDLDIDTIPAEAFMKNNSMHSTHDLRIVLPKGIKHLSDRSMLLWHKDCTFEVTGSFPTLGKDVLFYYNSDCTADSESRNREHFVVSEDNEQCVFVAGSGIMSADGDTLFFGSHCFSCIPEGTKVIAAHALESHGLYNREELVIPASVDVIGDRAFAGFYVSGAVVTNYSPVPQKLENDAFKEFASYAVLYVPEAAVSLYKAASGWKNFKEIRPIILSDIESWAEDTKPAATYDLQGRRLTKVPERGMYIQNGKVVMK